MPLDACRSTDGVASERNRRRDRRGGNEELLARHARLRHV
jgi:hypothetical protein